MVKLTAACPPPSAEKLRNPERGFYSIFRFTAKDRQDDIQQQVDAIYNPEQDDLLLAEINLHAYAEGNISDAGLRSIQTLFSSLRARNGSCIVRFLYDWEGRGLSSEPRDIGIIQRHMDALGPILRENEDMIFLLQGLFIGSWGEMHQSRYSDPENLRRLADTLRKAVGSHMLLSVRTPAQWRAVVGSRFFQGKEEEIFRSAAMGLFNDGIMGSETDLGTYEGSRASAISFQRQLCQWVPNGGEAVGGSHYSEFENAVETLGAMRVSYLNRCHDQRVLERWRSHTVSASGLWKGMDGMSYMERHLGYRFVIQAVKMTCSPFSRDVRARIDLRNEGFAPIYHSAKANVTLIGSGRQLAFAVPCDLRKALGSGDKNSVIRLEGQFPLSALGKGEFKAYMDVVSDKYHRRILLGNQGMCDAGYPIGRVVIV